MWRVSVVLCGRLVRAYGPLHSRKRFKWLWVATLYAWWNTRYDGDSWSAVTIERDFEP